MSTKNLQILSYLAKNRPGASVTVLIKLCYLADLISLKKGKDKISTFNYVRYYFGPFDKEIYDDLEHLVLSNVLIATSDYTNNGAETILYKFNEEQNLDTSNLTEDELGVLNEVVDKLRGYGAKALTDVAYKTEPMKAIGATLGGNEHLGEELDLNLVLK